MLIAVPTAVLLVLSLIVEIKPGFLRRFQRKSSISSEKVNRPRIETDLSSFAGPELAPFRCFVIGGAWFCLLFVLTLFFGFFVATLLFVPCFLICFARYPWWQIFVYTTVLFLVEWYGCDVLLGLSLWQGAVPEILRNFLGGGVLPPFL